MKVGIIGDGKFGTAIAFVAGQNHDVTIFCRHKNRVQNINKDHINTEIFPRYSIPKSIKAQEELDNSITQMDIIFIATPFQSLKEVFTSLKPFVKKGSIIINMAKGLQNKTAKTGSQIFEQFFGSKIRYGMLSGPNFAHEIMQKEPTATIIASKHKIVRTICQKALTTSFFKVQESLDVIGVELCAGFRSIISMAAGIHDSLGLGQNSKAYLLTTGMAEIGSLIQAMGGHKITIMSLCGVGDVFLTTTSAMSRNYKLGVWIGEGYNIQEALEKINSTVESIETIKTAFTLAQKHHVHMPILKTIHDLIKGEKITKETLIKKLI